MGKSEVQTFTYWADGRWNRCAASHAGMLRWTGCSPLRLRGQWLPAVRVTQHDRRLTASCCGRHAPLQQLASCSLVA
jgi:hypothetical protein